MTVKLDQRSEDTADCIYCSWIITAQFTQCILGYITDPICKNNNNNTNNEDVHDDNHNHMCRLLFWYVF